MDVDRILPNLFLGSHPGSNSDIDTLKDTGITAVLNVQTDDDFRFLGIDWPAQRARYFTHQIEVRRAPIRDFDDDSLRDTLPGAVRELDGLLQDGRVVYVHCTAGVNRSPSVVIAYLYWVRGYSLEEAERCVQDRHQCMPVMAAIRLAAWDEKRRF